MKNITIIQVIVSILLMVSILFQNRGSGLGGAYGDSFGGYYTKRGFEKFLLYVSIILSASFLILALVNFVVANK